MTVPPSSVQLRIPNFLRLFRPDSSNLRQLLVSPTTAGSAMVQPDSGYDPADAKQKLEELDALLPKVQVPAHREKFVKVQDYLKKNNSLIKSVVEAQEKALKEGGQSADKRTLQHCAEMIKELNENLTQVYDIYNHLSDS